jgi:hypothetical protein
MEKEDQDGQGSYDDPNIYVWGHLLPFYFDKLPCLVYLLYKLDLSPTYAFSFNM